MAEPSAVGSRPSLFERLLAESREAHACGQHEVAYHALTAAMHAADDAADVAAHEAAAQLEHIDVHAPEHRLSTRSAARHAHPGVYTLLTRQSAMHVQMHEARERYNGSRARGHWPEHTHDVVRD